MEELRELILAHLEELHGTGLSDERYQLYVDTVYQCDSVDKLIELAALELQLEAHEFFLQLVEQLHEYDDERTDPYVSSREELEFQNSDGFGDEDAEVENEFFPDEEDDGFGYESPSVSTPSKINFAEPANSDIFSGFDEHESNHDDEIDPSVLAMQKALLGGGDDMSDPSYFDIDALLTKAGSVTTEITLGAQPPAQEYNDELADLLSAYEDDEESDEIEFDSISEPVQPSKIDGFGQPVSFGQPVGFGKPAQPSGFNKPAQPVPTQGFGQPIKPVVPKQAPVQQAPKQPQRPAPTGVAMNNAKNVFAGFSKRKPSK